MRLSPRRRPRLWLERLETRMAPSFGAAGPEFRVNSYTTSGQSIPRAATDADGDFVVAWNSRDQDGSDYGVYAQRYSSAGVPQGGEFQVNTFTTGTQAFPVVAMGAAGDFVIVWTSLDQDGSGDGVYAQRYSAAGAPQGGEFRANTFTTGHQRFPAVAMSAAGDFVVAWQSEGQDGSSYGVYAQRYGAGGAPLGGEVQVNTFTGSIQARLAVAMGAAGDFVVAWGSNTQDGSGYGVYAQRFTAAGAPAGGEFRVNTFTTGNQYAPSVAVRAAGDFVVAWVSGAQDGNGYGVFAQRYSAAGVPQGAEFRVNTVTTNNQSRPTAAADADGDFVIAWQSTGQDGGNAGIYAQRFGASGALLSVEFLVNTYTPDNQSRPALAADADGDFVLVWDSLNQEDAASSYGIYAQRYHANRPPNTNGLPNRTIPVSLPTALDLSAGFTDADDGLAGLTLTVVGNSNPALFASATVNGSTLTLTPAGTAGTAVLTVRATDPDGAFVETSFTVTIAGGAPRILNTQINDGSPQHSRVTSITVIFSTAVTFAGTPEAAFNLIRIMDPAPVTFTASVSTNGLGQTVVTLGNFSGLVTQFGSLMDGRYLLTALAGQISAGGLALDGDGNGTGGDNYLFGEAQGLFRYYGDMNGDRRVDIADFGFFSLAYLTPANYNSALDFNNDGRIDIADFGQFSVRYFTMLP